MRIIPRTRWGKALAVALMIAVALIVLPQIFAPQSPFSAQCRRDVAMYNHDVYLANNATSGAAQYVDATLAQVMLGQEKRDCA